MQSAFTISNFNASRPESIFSFFHIKKTKILLQLLTTQNRILFGWKTSSDVNHSKQQVCLYIFRSIYEDICQEQFEFTMQPNFNDRHNDKKQTNNSYDDIPTVFPCENRRSLINQSHKVQSPSSNLANTCITTPKYYKLYILFTTMHTL